MGPALIEPDHRSQLHKAMEAGVPQWGRLSSSRITGRCGAGREGPLLAAMGPALIEPDHVQNHPQALSCVQMPQWGRLSSSRITRVLLPGVTAHDLAAMGPALIEPDHEMEPCGNWRVRSGRNGAGSHRAGSRDPDRPPVTVIVQPQWGRLSSSRITGHLRDASDLVRRRRNGAGSHRAGSRRTANRPTLHRC